jgi:hypothetical protein
VPLKSRREAWRGPQLPLSLPRSRHEGLPRAGRGDGERRQGSRPAMGLADIAHDPTARLGLPVRRAAKIDGVPMAKPAIGGYGRVAAEAPAWLHAPVRRSIQLRARKWLKNMVNAGN